MPSEPQYHCDPEFFRLIHRETPFDLERVCLEISRDEYPDLEIDLYLTWLDEVADGLREEVRQAKNEQEALNILSRELAADRGFYGTSEAFRDPRCSYLNRVIDTGRGLPITLSIVYLGIARRLGIHMVGVASPMHFVCRTDTFRGPLFLDAFSHGRILSEAECLDWLQRVSQLPEEVIQRSLGPADERLIVLRMLNNLKTLYAQHEKWSSLWKVQHRLCALQPGNWQERRDLGMVSFKANRPGKAIELLSDCLKVCGDEQDRQAMQHEISQARDLLAQMN